MAQNRYYPANSYYHPGSNRVHSRSSGRFVGANPHESSKSSLNFGIGEHIAGISVFSAGINELTLGLVAMKGTLSVVETGLNALGKSAMEVVGAIAQIGGARGIQQMFVEAATTERTAANIASNTTDSISTAEVKTLISKLSASSEFTPGEIGSAIRAFVGKTGSVKGFDQLGSFATDLASVSGLGAEQSGAILGQIRAEFPAFSIEQTKQAARNLWGLGKSGAVELKDTTDISQVLGLASKISPDALKGMNLEMGLTQLAQIYTGGQSATEAVTGVRRVQQDLLIPGSAHKTAALHQVLGDFLTTSDTGQQVFANAPETLAKLALAAGEGKISTREIDSRGFKALQGIEQQAESQFRPGMSETEKIKILENMFRKFEDTEVTVDEFDGALKNVKETVEYQFKETFNKLSIELEGSLLPVLKQMEPALNLFAKGLINDKEKIAEYFSSLAHGLAVLAVVVPELASILLFSFNTIGGALLGFLSAIPGAGFIATSISQSIKNTNDKIKTEEENIKFEVAGGADAVTEKIPKEGYEDYERGISVDTSGKKVAESADYGHKNTPPHEQKMLDWQAKLYAVSKENVTAVKENTAEIKKQKIAAPKTTTAK